jgi:hypothetical protein
MPDYSGHMTHDEYTSLIWQKLLGLAQATLDDKIGIVEATLQMEPILYELRLNDDADLQQIIGLGSECEYMVFGEEAKLKPRIVYEQQPHLRERESTCSKAIKSACIAILRLGAQRKTEPQPQSEREDT